MNVANTQIQMRKGLLEFCVLHIISRGEVYTSDLIEELTQAQMIVVEGTLYPLLNRLKSASLVEYRWVESESDLRGNTTPSRKKEKPFWAHFPIPGIH